MLSRIVRCSSLLAMLTVADSYMYSRNRLGKAIGNTGFLIDRPFTVLAEGHSEPSSSSKGSNGSTASISLDVANFRKEYSQLGLTEQDIASDPMEQFRRWFNDACDAKVLEPNAMCLSTCKDNKPSARIVLLKAFDERGFVWYTNYQSRKGSEIGDNPFASLTFWWGDLERSIRIEGVVEKVSEEESDAYFNSRPRGSRLGAWTSNQSSPIAGRDALEAQEKAISDKFKDQEEVPRPKHWGGYRLIPNRIEFWKGRQSRLHDRLVFSRKSSSESDSWALERLQP